MISPYIILACAGIMLCCLFSKRRSSHSKLPPGPRGLPIVGNVRDLPPENIPPYQHWLKHRELYGPVSSVTVLGQTMILLHDLEAAIELMERRSFRYSSRPFMRFAFELAGGKDYTGNLPYSDALKTSRRLMRSTLGTKALLAKFRDIQEAAVGRFLLRTLEKPSNLIGNLQIEVGATILGVIYGYNVEPERPDPIIVLITTMLQNFSAAMIPGAWAVDLFPLLRYLPAYLPGCKFQKTARRHKHINSLTVDIPYEFAKRQVARGSKTQSFVSSIIESKNGVLDEEEEHAVKWSAGSIYGAASDTTVASLAWFFHAMVLFPEVQRKAQSELDRVLGFALAQTTDRERLPYISALVLELFRWNPVVAMGVPHVSDEEDNYAGHRIPKGAVLMPVVWWYGRNPTVYRDPDDFSPERFLAPRCEPSPDFAFGFGRRVCPGRLLGESSVFLTIAQVLTVFDIRKSVDGDGGEIQPSSESLAGFLNLPVPYSYHIVPRSEDHERLIRQVRVDQHRPEGDAKLLQSFDMDAPF